MCGGLYSSRENPFFQKMLSTRWTDLRESLSSNLACPSKLFARRAKWERLPIIFVTSTDVTWLSSYYCYYTPTRGNAVCLCENFTVIPWSWLNYEIQGWVPGQIALTFIEQRNNETEITREKWWKFAKIWTQHFSKYIVARQHNKRFTSSYDANLTINSVYFYFINVITRAVRCFHRRLHVVIIVKV